MYATRTMTLWNTSCMLRNSVTWRVRNALPSCTKCFNRQLHSIPLTHKMPQLFVSISPQSYFQGIVISRSYAKGKDRKKSDRGKVELNRILILQPRCLIQESNFFEKNYFVRKYLVCHYTFNL